MGTARHPAEICELRGFEETVFGLNPAHAGETIMPALTGRYASALGRHKDDVAVG